MLTKTIAGWKGLGRDCQIILAISLILFPSIIFGFFPYIDLVIRDMDITWASYWFILPITLLLELIGVLCFLLVVCIGAGFQYLLGGEINL